MKKWLICPNCEIVVKDNNKPIICGECGKVLISVIEVKKEGKT